MDCIRRFRSVFAAACSAALIGLALSACGGGGSGSTIPAQPTSLTQPDPGAGAPGPTSPDTTASLSVSSADKAAAASASHLKYHLYPIQKASAKAAARSVLHASAINYPADLVYSGGPVVKTAVSHNIYINCSSSCYGGPQVFIDSINNSSFIHIVDQYTGSTANHRYAAGSNLAVNEPLYDNYLSQGDLFAMIHSAALRFGHGYTNIYHVFLPSGADTCFDLSTTCYSPDNFSTWVFCAYHGSIDFPDSTGHVLFTILPYQNVPGCQQTGGPNSSLVDSTASTMSHEYIETITDPDPGSGWYNFALNFEIADLCQSFSDVDTLYGRKYLIQEEYSNKVHACTNSP